MFKKFFIISLVSQTAFAAPYIELKDEYELKDYSKRTDHLRFGYASKHAYFEIGPMTNGVSWETGFNFKSNNFSWKTKIETKDEKSKVETKLRYTF